MQSTTLYQILNVHCSHGFEFEERPLVLGSHGEYGPQGLNGVDDTAHYESFVF